MFVSEDVHVTITMKHPIERFLGFAGFLGVHLDIVSSIDTTASVTDTLGVAPYFHNLACNGIALRRDGAVAGGQIGVVDVHLAERTMDAEFLLHDDLLISEK